MSSAGWADDIIWDEAFDTLAEWRRDPEVLGKSINRTQVRIFEELLERVRTYAADSSVAAPDIYVDGPNLVARFDTLADDNSSFIYNFVTMLVDPNGILSIVTHSYDNDEDEVNIKGLAEDIDTEEIVLFLGVDGFE